MAEIKIQGRKPGVFVSKVSRLPVREPALKLGFSVAKLYFEIFQIEQALHSSDYASLIGARWHYLDLKVGNLWLYLFGFLLIPWNWRRSLYFD